MNRKNIKINYKATKRTTGAITHSIQEYVKIFETDNLLGAKFIQEQIASKKENDRILDFIIDIDIYSNGTK